MMRRIASAAIVAWSAGLMAPAATSAEEPLRVFAAASLTEAFHEIAAAFKEDAGASVELNLAGSQLLRTQLEQGAAADVFASADIVHADALKQSHLLGDYKVFARNA